VQIRPIAIRGNSPPPSANLDKDRDLPEVRRRSWDLEAAIRWWVRCTASLMENREPGCCLRPCHNDGKHPPAEEAIANHW